MKTRALIAHRSGVCAECALATHRAFSLVELMVVMAVVVMLTALMMPAMQQLRENAQRVVCMSHMQQMGQAFFMFAADHDDELPRSNVLVRGDSPQDLMMAREAGAGEKWDGLGHLYNFNYCDAPECFYCPSHHGEHSIERYQNAWSQSAPSQPIFTNYHYAGHVDWKLDRGRKRSLIEGDRLVLMTDGLRTASDFNHIFGMNSLRGDGSVAWRDDVDEIYQVLPLTVTEEIPADYVILWDLVQQER